jgi:hypothetical protein
VALGFVLLIGTGMGVRLLVAAVAILLRTGRTS